MTFEQELMRARSAYFLDGWLKFNEEMWGYKAERVMYTLPGKERPALEGVLYLTKSGKVRMPPCNAYLPLQFHPTPTEKNCQLYTQWMSVAKLLAEDIKKRGIAGNISFPPGFTDGRWFQWLGFDVTFKYTFVSRLPISDNALDKRIYGHINKAINLKYKVTETNDWASIISCLNQTAEAQSFDNIISEDIMKKLEGILSKNILGHVVLSEYDEIVAGQIKICLVDGICLGWLAGTNRNHILNGVNQLVTLKSIGDLCLKGGKFFDNCGADIESVARAKAAWGFPLVPQIMLLDKSIHNTLKRTIAQIHGARTLYHKARALARAGSRHEQ